MAYHDDLLEHAALLSELDLQTEPKQVTLRRCVSAAYYALFHLLTTEAAKNWKHPGQRDRFARLFDHGRMKTCSAKVASRPLPVEPSDALVATELRIVADSFLRLQQARHTADYDNSVVWSRAQVYELVRLAHDARASWSKIYEKELAQEYLLELMGTRA
jgi:uncharacterized protein (UPF0332 family)